MRSLRDKADDLVNVTLYGHDFGTVIVKALDQQIPFGFEKFLVIGTEYHVDSLFV